MSEPRRDSGAGEKEKNISKSSDQEIEKLTTELDEAKIDEGTQIQSTKVKGDKSSSHKPATSTPRRPKRNGPKNSQTKPEIEPPQGGASPSQPEKSSVEKKEFYIYAYTLPPAMNEPGIQLVKVGYTEDSLAVRFTDPRSAWEKAGVCKQHKFLYLGSGRRSPGCKVQYKELFIKAKFFVPKTEIKNTEALTRYLLGQPVTVAYVKRRLETLDLSEHLHTLFEGHCGFTEWVVCSQEKIDALKEDKENNKVVSKNETHESSTAFLETLHTILGTNPILS